MNYSRLKPKQFLGSVSAGDYLKRQEVQRFHDRYYSLPVVFIYDDGTEVVSVMNCVYDGFVYHLCDDGTCHYADIKSALNPPVRFRVLQNGEEIYADILQQKSMHT